MNNWEQKYKDLIARLQKAKENDDVCDERYCCVIDEIAPELKESEDEKVRKELLSFCQYRADSYPNDPRYSNIGNWIAWLEKQKNLTDEEYGQGKKDVLWCINQAKKNAKDENEMGTCWFAENWLEKQGEHNDKVEPKFKIGDKVCAISNRFECTIENIDESTYYGDTTNFDIKDQDKWKLIEQKPTDKVKPKFKAGDWVVCEVTGSVYQIKNCIENLSNHRYGYDLTNGGYIGSDEVNHYRLWTIQDAKDGDVLYHKAENGIEYIVMSKGLNEHNNIDSYFRYNSINGFGIDIPSVLSAKYDSITPATKEQRDLLFQKMKEAGYEWDAEKKEPKKIEDRVEKALHKAGYEWSEETHHLKKIDQKPAKWSEEDEEHIKRIIEHFEGRKKDLKTQWVAELHNKEITWLKSLKDRMQPKQEWSEEDKNVAEDIEEAIRNYWHGDTLDILLDWLKYLKDRVQSKQEWCVDDNHEYFSELLENDNSDNIDDYAYQCAYCMSHDWMKESPTWDDVERACKLGAEWNERHHNSSWSEDDEEKFRDVIRLIEQGAPVQSMRDHYTNWFKSLKDRVQPIHEYSDTEKQEIFLRSQRPHFWRPTKGQLECLDVAIDKVDKDHSPFFTNRAYLTLKALKKQLEQL